MAQFGPIWNAPTAMSSTSSQTTSENHFTLPTNFQRTLDKAFAIAPTEPYVLTVPSEHPYHLRREAQDCWRIAGLFREQEERLQHQTFVQQDLMDSIFQQVSMQDYRHGDRPVMPSAVRLPLAAGTAKKKISLSDYKKKSKTTTESSVIRTKEKESSQTMASQQENDIVDSAETTANTSRTEQAAPGGKATRLLPTGMAPSLATEDAQSVESVRKAIDIRAAERRGRPTLADVVSNSRKRPLHQGPDLTERQPTPKRAKVDGGRALDSTADTDSSHAVRRPQGVTKELKLDVRTPAKTHTASTSIIMPKRRDSSPAPAVEQPKLKKLNTEQKPSARVKSEPRKTVLPTPPGTEDREPPIRSHRDPPPWVNFPASSRPLSEWTLPRRRSETPEELRMQFRQDREFRERRARLRAERGLTTPPASSPDTTGAQQTSEEQYYEFMAELRRNREERRREKEEALQTNSKGIAHKHPVTAVQPNDTQATQIPQKEKPATPAIKAEHDLATNQRAANSATAEHENEQDEQLIVKLRFSKTMRKTVQQYLRLKPTPRPAPNGSYIANLMAQSKPVTPAVVKPSVKKEEHLQHANETPKPQVPPLQNSSSTLGTSLLKTASHLTTKDTTPVLQSVAAKSLKPSPLPVKKKDVVDSTQKKPTPRALPATTALAAETPAPSNPGRDITTPSTNSEIILSTPPSSASNASTDRPADSAKWNAEFLRLREIGKTLKKKSEAAITSESASISSPMSPLRALHRIESLLAFMLSFLARDMTVAPVRRNNRPAFNGWSTILPFAQQTAPFCEPWPHLAGLAHLLTSVCEGAVVVAGGRGQVHLAVPSSDKSAAEIESRIQKDVEVMMRAASEMQVHASEAELLIPMKGVLEKEYADAVRELRAGALVGGIGTKPSAAVRMGLLVLKTWVKRPEREDKEIEWTPSLALGDCGGL